MKLKVLLNLSVLLICATGSGCQSAGGVYAPLAEHTPRASSPDYRQGNPAIISLYQWKPDTSDLGPARKEIGPVEIPTEVKQLHVGGNVPIGFRQRGGQVVAVAGETELQLPEGHYSWEILTQDPRVPRPRDDNHGSFTVMVGGYDPRTDRFAATGESWAW